MMLNSDEINIANKNFVNRMIQHKKRSNPYYSSGPSPMTDMDTFPYPRFFRDSFTSDAPIIFEREAGWLPRNDFCYKIPVVTNDVKMYPNHCFQAAPSTTYPCYPEYLRKYSDKKELNLQLFKTNVNEYR